MGLSMNRRKLPEPPATLFQDWIPVRHLVNWIADIERRDGETTLDARKRVRDRIDDAAKRKKAFRKRRKGSPEVEGHLARVWAAMTWPSLEPIFGRPKHMQGVAASLDPEGFAGWMSSEIPDDLVACQRKLKQLLQRIRDLEAENQQLKTKLRSYEKRRKKSSGYGKEGGRGRQK